MPSPVRALVDANVLYSNHLRNLLLQMAQNGAFEVRWTAEIEDEWLRNMEPDTQNRITSGTLPLIRKFFPEALVGNFDPTLKTGRTDAKDRHVAAAARHISPCVLVKENVRHFDVAVLREANVEVRTADEFLVGLVDTFANNPGFIRQTVDEARISLKKSMPSWDEYLTLLAERQGLPRFVERLRGMEPTPEPTDTI
jgi:hypothetical protein